MKCQGVTVFTYVVVEAMGRICTVVLTPCH